MTDTPWWRPSAWKLLFERALLREWLGLNLWFEIDAEQRLSDERGPIDTVAATVSLCEESAHLPEHGSEQALQNHLFNSLQTQVRYRSVVQRLHEIHRSLLNGPELIRSPATASAVKQKMRGERKQLRKKVVRETPLLRLPFEQIREVIPFIIAFFLLSGYLISNGYLGHFGIRVSRFYSIWDYVSASMNGLSGLLSSLAISLCIVILFMYRVKLRVLQQRLRVGHIWRIFLWMVFCALLALLIYRDQVASNRLSAWVYGVALFGSAFITSTIAVFFQKPMRAKFILTFSLLYCAAVYSIVEGSIIWALSPHENSEFFYRVQMVDDKTPGELYRVLIGNSTWVFMQDAQMSIHVVPIQQIRDMTLVPPQQP